MSVSCNFESRLSTSSGYLKNKIGKKLLIFHKKLLQKISVSVVKSLSIVIADKKQAMTQRRLTFYEKILEITFLRNLAISFMGS